MEKKFKIVFNSPVIIYFTIICFVATLLGQLTGTWTDVMFFSVYNSSMSDPLTYIRFIGHIFGHSGFDHFLGNIMMILITGPLLEEKYGSVNLGVIIFVTAIITGVVQFAFFDTRLLGASGVVFAFILLSSITRIKDDGLPLTFIMVAVLYIGEEIYSGIFVSDNISQVTHIVGGIVGASLGFIMNNKPKKKVATV